MNNLPALLRRTDVILEMRDARLPLTSINPSFEHLFRDWTGKGKGREVQQNTELRKRIIVFSKMDLVPHWGIEVSAGRMQSIKLTSWYEVALYQSHEIAGRRQ